jgi:hypothetical protein
MRELVLAHADWV